MKDKLLVEIDRGFEVEMRNETPERDAGGRKKIKQRKVGLENTGAQLLDFRDSWVVVEDQRVEIRQKSDRMSRIWKKKKYIYNYKLHVLLIALRPPQNRSKLNVMKTK